MISASLTNIFIRFIIAWLLVSLVFFFCGEEIFRALLSYMVWITNLLAQDFSVDLNIGDSAAGKIISIIATSTEDVYRLGIPIAPKGTRINGNATLLHALVPMVILFTILLAWPTTFKNLIIQLVLAIPVMLLLLALMTPALLVSHIEQIFHTAAQNYTGDQLPIPFIMGWVEFMEIGGVWLLPIIGAFLCIKLRKMLAAINR